MGLICSSISDLSRKLHRRRNALHNFNTIFEEAYMFLFKVKAADYKIKGEPMHGANFA